jgi:hypothetical protein
MTAGHLSKEEGMEASRQAQRIQKTINSAVGRRLVRCVAPLRLIRTRDVSSPDQGARFGVELRVEPLVTITDFQDQPARRFAATLREWAALFNQAAASLER